MQAGFEFCDIVPIEFPCASFGNKIFAERSEEKQMKALRMLRGNGVARFLLVPPVRSEVPMRAIRMGTGDKSEVAKPEDQCLHAEAKPMLHHVEFVNGDIATLHLPDGITHGRARRKKGSGEPVACLLLVKVSGICKVEHQVP